MSSISSAPPFQHAKRPPEPPDLPAISGVAGGGRSVGLTRVLLPRSRSRSLSSPPPPFAIHLFVQHGDREQNSSRGRASRRRLALRPPAPTGSPSRPLIRSRPSSARRGSRPPPPPDRSPPHRPPHPPPAAALPSTSRVRLPAAPPAAAPPASAKPSRPRTCSLPPHRARP